MKKSTISMLAVGACFIATPVMAEESPVLGSWNTEAVTDFGTFAATLVVSESEDGYSIEMIDAPMEGPGAQAGPAMESVISDVTVDGSAFAFKRSITTPQGPMEISYSGTVEGDALTAEAVTTFGTIPMTGTRAE